MTLVIGTVCDDGVLFCADTEEGTESGQKRHVMKLYTEGCGDWTLVIGTAGHGALSKMTAQNIIRAAFSAKDSFISKREDIIQVEVAALYKKYIHPYPAADPKNYERQFKLVIGLLDTSNRASPQPYLYTTEEEILYPQLGRFACAGVGEIIGYYYLDQLFRDERPLKFTS